MTDRPKARDPFRELLGEFSDRLRGDHWQPAIDVFETEKAVVVRVDLAGVRSDDLRVTVDGDTLHLRGARRLPTGADVQRLHQMEIPSGPFERRVRIPFPFEREQVQAHLEDGFLTVTLRKRLPQRHRIPIASEPDRDA
jgi:HSP20 family protein